MSTAALVTGWQRASPQAPAAFIGTPGDAESPAPAGPTVEIYYDEAWHDISTYVLYENRITITRGRPDEASSTNPAQCTLTLNNRLGYFSPKNPVSPLYGKIGRNTPLRVSKVVQGTRFYRFHGEVVSWPDTFDITGQDVRTPITAAGIRQRLNQGDTPLRSSMYREHTKTSRVGIVGYWPFEEKADATQVASGLSSGTPMTITGSPTFASYSDWKASDSLPVLNGAAFSGKISPYTASSTPIIAIDLIILFQTAVSTARIWTLGTTGSAARWDLLTDSSGDLQLKAYDSTGIGLLDTGLITFNAANRGLQMLRVLLTQNGANIDWEIDLFPLSNDMLSTNSLVYIPASGTLSSQTIGTAKTIGIGPDGGLTTVAAGHLAIGANLSSFAGTGGALTAWNGEDPTHRYNRLCQEEGISFETLVRTDLGNNTTMGWQGLTTLPDLLQQVVDTDLGVDVEPRDQLGLLFRPHSTLYNQAAALTLDCAQHQLSAPLAPQPDDQKTVNDLTVTRDGGSFARFELEEGPMSVLASPAGVGRYDDAKTLSLGDDGQCLQQAGWRVHLGTVDEPRYPTVQIELSHPTFATSYAMTAAALALEVGDRIDVLNPPAPTPPDDIALLAQGYTEVLDQFLHEITFNCTPYSPWNVAVVGASGSRVATSGSQLHQDYPDPAATSLLVDVTAGSLWTTTPAHFPFDVRVAGEVWTVTGIAGSGSPQTFTVTRSVNGVSKGQYAGAAVQLDDVPIVSL